MPAAMWLARDVMAYCRYITVCSTETCHPSPLLCDVWHDVQEMGDPCPSGTHASAAYTGTSPIPVPVIDIEISAAIGIPGPAWHTGIRNLIPVTATINYRSATFSSDEPASPPACSSSVSASGWPSVSRDTSDTAMAATPQKPASTSSAVCAWPPWHSLITMKGAIMPPARPMALHVPKPSERSDVGNSSWGWVKVRVR